MKWGNGKHWGSHPTADQGLEMILETPEPSSFFCLWECGLNIQLPTPLSCFISKGFPDAPGKYIWMDRRRRQKRDPFFLHASGRWMCSSPLVLSTWSQLVMLVGIKEFIRNIHGFKTYFLTCSPATQVPLLCFFKCGGNQEGFPSQALFTPPFWALTLVTDAGQIWNGSLIFTASSFIPTVKKWFLKSAWSCGKRNMWWHQERDNKSENLFERRPHEFCANPTTEREVTTLVLEDTSTAPSPSKVKHRVCPCQQRHPARTWSTRRLCSPKWELGWEMTAWESPMGRTPPPLTATTLWEQLRVHRYQDSNWSPQGNEQHGCKQLSTALIHPDGCPAPAGHQNKHLGRSPKCQDGKVFFPARRLKMD